MTSDLPPGIAGCNARAFVVERLHLQVGCGRADRRTTFRPRASWLLAASIGLGAAVGRHRDHRTPPLADDAAAEVPATVLATASQSLSGARSASRPVVLHDRPGVHMGCPLLATRVERYRLSTTGSDR